MGSRWAALDHLQQMQQITPVKLNYSNSYLQDHKYNKQYSTSICNITNYTSGLLNHTIILADYSITKQAFDDSYFS